MIGDSPEDISSSPRLGNREAVLGVEVLGLYITVDGGRFRIPDTSNLEHNSSGSLGLDLERRAKDREILGQEVVGGLAKILCTRL